VKKVPGHKVHTFVDRVFFGKAYFKLHRKMDEPVYWLGKKHRILNHDAATAVCIARCYYPGDKNAEEAAYTHILLDDFCTANPAWKKLLEQLAYTDAKRRKQERQKKIRRRGRQQASKLREDGIIGYFFEYIKFYRGVR
jgi:hypothetical protein